MTDKATEFVAGLKDETKKVLSIADIENATDVEYFEIEAWGGIVRIGSLTADDFIEWQEANEGPAKRTAGLRLIVKSLVDEQNTRIGTDKHIELFKKKSVAMTEKVVSAIVKLNGLKVKGDAAKND